MTPIFRRLALLAAAIPAAAGAQGFENLDNLDVQVAASLGAAIGQPGGARQPIDRRLRLAPCAEPVTVDAPAMGAVAVRCASRGWRIRVPLVADASTQAPHVTPASAPVRAAPIVRRGDQVTVVARSASFTVSAIGTADQDGSPGDRIRVRMEQRAAPLIGEVLPDGRIALPGFN
jgi:flagella basal body P-ring formation protein FlgA